MSKTVNAGNNESYSIGISESASGYTALTPTRSKTFKTRKGAENWLDRNWKGWRSFV